MASDPKRQKLKEIQRRYRDKKKEKAAAQEQQIRDLTEQLAQLQCECDRLAQANSQLDRFARLSLSQSVAAVPAAQEADEEGLAYGLLANFATVVSRTNQGLSVDDVRGMSIGQYEQMVDRAYIRSCAELLLRVDTPDGLERLEEFVLSTRAAGLRALQHLPLKLYSQLNACLSSTFAQTDEQADMRLEPCQETALVQACHAFHAARQRIWDERRSITARLQAPDLEREEPFHGPELRSANSRATGAVLEASEALKASIRQERQAVSDWYYHALQVLTPLQEARAIMAAAPLAFSPWYVARYLDRARAGWDSLLLLEEWSREPRTLDGLDAVMLLGEGDPLDAGGLLPGA